MGERREEDREEEKRKEIDKIIYGDRKWAKGIDIGKGASGDVQRKGKKVEMQKLSTNP